MPTMAPVLSLLEPPSEVSELALVFVLLLLLLFVSVMLFEVEGKPAK